MTIQEMGKVLEGLVDEAFGEGGCRGFDDLLDEITTLSRAIMAMEAVARRVGMERVRGDLGGEKADG